MGDAIKTKPAGTIYRDEKRTILMSGGELVVQNARGTKTISLSSEIETRLSPKVVEALRQQGEDPAGWYALIVPRQGKFGGGELGVFPAATRPAVEAAIREYREQQERREAANREYRNRPEVVARQKVDALFALARRSQDEEEYHPILQEARHALADWRQKFPAAARAERVSGLLADAEELEDRAVGALVYDADGSLSPADQERSAASLRARAATLRELARVEEATDA